MSNAEQRGVAMALPDSNVEVLERRLLELRAEIDAILMQLAGQKAAARAIALGGAIEPQTKPAATATEPMTGDAASIPAADVDVMSDLSLSDEAADQGGLLAAVDISEQPAILQPSPAGAPAATLPLVAEAQELPAGEIPSARASDDFTLIASIDADLAGRLNGLGVVTFAEMAAWTQGDVQRIAEALELDRAICKENWIEQAALLAAGKATTFASQRSVEADAKASQAPSAIEPSADVAALAPTPPLMSLDPTSAEPSPAAPATAMPAANDQQPAGAAPAPASAQAPAETQVISFEPRHRKQKAGFAAASTTPARSGRRLMAKVAACLLALLAGATALVVADRTAVGGVLPWIAPLPSYLPSSGISWPTFGELRGVPFTAGGRAVIPVLPAEDDALLGRYREVWPAGS